MASFMFKITVLGDVSDYEDFDEPEEPTEGVQYFETPSRTFSVVMACALEQVGVFDVSGFTMDESEDGGFLIRGYDDEPFMFVEAVTQVEFEPEEEAA